MSAQALPLEVLLQVFQCLDARSYFAARKVCRWWHAASFDLMTVNRLLQRLPILPAPNGMTGNVEDLYRLRDRASRALMLEMSVQQESEASPTELYSRPAPPFAGMPTASSTSANMMAVMDDQIFRFFDMRTRVELHEQQRPVHERFGSGLWLKAPTPSKCRLALSSRGHLLAVAYKHNIQIYDLSPGSSRCTVSDGISDSNDDHILGIEFDGDDSLLQVHLSHKGRVVYLGSPGSRSTDYGYWAGDGGLRNRFLDSSLLAFAGVPEGGRPVWLSGLQLLRPLSDGHLFAAQRHGGGQSSRYTLAHVKGPQDTPSAVSIAQARTVTEIARLESFLSGQDYNLDGLSEIDMGTWDSMPSAHEHQPRFSLSDDGSVLLLAEMEKKRFWPSPTTQLFVYRLRGIKGFSRDMEGAFKDADVAAHLGNGHKDRSEQYSIAAIPYCLGTVKGRRDIDATTARVEGEGSSYTIKLTTDEDHRLWRLENVSG